MVISFNLPTKSVKSIIISSSLEMDTEAEGHCFLIAKLGFETRSSDPRCPALPVTIPVGMSLASSSNNCWAGWLLFTEHGHLSPTRWQGMLACAMICWKTGVSSLLLRGGEEYSLRVADVCVFS